ncbi:tetratricopeptide repeat protein [Devosia psychrophila]|uniref:TPR repeat n=1 Tax=Devosia psychrophila TaxID=728005 RepID=A0A0F5PZB6_9HYPH|nr:tetratricopeptide repeat protein [Devosia psychrophila]KKC33950.1 hypothetical protein WH91_05690 [Devosia psychrophila]SFD17994.1 hypothetical protein SAMN04488059_12616 [Devosia psychrophila]
MNRALRLKPSVLAVVLLLLSPAVIAAQDVSAVATSTAAAAELESMDPTALVKFANEQRAGILAFPGNPLLVPHYDLARAALEKAVATAGVPPAGAKLALAKMLLAGEGGQVDFDRAIELLQQEFAAGEAEAGMILGSEFLQVSGREQEGADALLLALRLGDAAAAFALADYHRQSDPEQSARFERLAFSMLEARVASQDNEAAFELAEYYRRTGPAHDIDKALSLYGFAYEGGNERALYWMASIRAESSVASDRQEAVRLFDLAAQRGSVEAARALAVAHSTGELEVSDELNALWLDRLVELGDVAGELLLANQASTSPQDRNRAAAKLFDELMAETTPSITDLLELGGKFRDGDGVAVDGERALQLFKRALDRGSKDGVLRYAELILADPSLQTQDNLRAAFDSLQLIASSGSVSGAVTLGDYYVQGLGVQSDPDEALKWYERAVQGGNSISAMSRIAEQYVASTDPAKQRLALPWWEKAAAAGSITAQVTIANAYAQATWLSFNPLKATLWYSKAIAAGDLTSVDALAKLHVQFGGAAGLATAEQVYTDAIDAGLKGAGLRYATFLASVGRDAEAVALLQNKDEPLTTAGALLLRRLFTTGEAGQQALDKADHYLEIAREEVSSDPAERLVLADALLDSEKPEDQAEAVTLLKELSAQRLPGVVRMLGDAYIMGRGTAKDVETGLNIYTRGIGAGEIEASVGLAELYAEGVYLPAEPQKALELFTQALVAAPRNSGANSGLADLYRSGALGKPDLAKAARHYLAAAAAGSNSAKLALGDLYMWGSGVDRDARASEQWLTQASLAGGVDAQIRLAALNSSVIAGPAKPREAFAHALQAASRGDVEAMRIVGVSLLSGFGTPQSRDHAIAWLERAAAAQSSDAVFDLFRVFDEGAAGPRDAELAAQWLRKAADLANPSALYRLALESLQPDGSISDPAAIELLTQAAHANHNQSKKMLVRLGLLSASEAEAGFDDE